MVRSMCRKRQSASVQRASPKNVTQIAATIAKWRLRHGFVGTHKVCKRHASLITLCALALLAVSGYSRERGKLKGAQIESVRKFVEQSAEAAQKRNEIVSRGIRHAAVGMTADALIKAEEHLRPLTSGTLVRVSYAHINLKVRQELKCGFKRARDLNSWSPELYYIVSPPSNADKLHNHGSLYKVNKVGKVAAPGDPDLSVARQDLLAISSPAASANDAQRVADLQSLMRGEDTVVKKYVTLRQNYDAPTAQRR